MLSVLLEALQRLVAFIDRRRAGALVVVAGLILAVGLSGAGAGIPVVGPLAGALHSGLLRVFSIPGRAFDWFTTPRVSEAELTGMRLEIARLREAERENAMLRAMLGYSPLRGFRPRPGRIIRLDLDPLRGEAWIDLGRHHGLAGGEAVVSPEGLAGVVIRAGERASVVRLLRNREAPVGVRDTRSRVIGVADWDAGEGRHRVNYVPKLEDVAEGDTLISSGLGGVYPAGLPVGTVAAVSEPPEAPLKEIVLAPFVPFHRLQQIFVLLPAPGDTVGYPGDEFGPVQGGG